MSVMFAFKYSAGAAARSMPAYDDGSTPTLVTEKPPAVAITQYGEDVAGTLTARNDSSPCSDRGQNIVYAVRMREGCRGEGKGPLVQENVSGTLATGNDQTIFGGGYVVRRLTPVETERLQGFPDGWTDLTGCDADAVAEKVAASLLYDEKQAAALRRKVGKWSQECPDGPRYKALGNSMAVPNMRWIFERVQAYDTMMETEVV